MSESSTATPISHRFEDATHSRPRTDQLDLSLPLDGLRGDCRLRATALAPAVLREGLLTLCDVLVHDLRRQPRNRADYLAYLLAQGKRVTAEVWNAQKAYLAAQFDAAASEEGPLAPTVTVDAEGVAFEVFSADESVYARLFLPRSSLAIESEARGTSHVDLGAPQIRQALRRVRAHRETHLALQPSQGGETRRVNVPYRWLRALGQVQSASTLPAWSFELDPVDLYNVLFVLRMRKAKHAPRALRYELVPGERPRIILEPWEQVFDCRGPVFEGPRPCIVRTWGRARLALLARLLPHTRRLRVHLVGAGQPSYYALDLGDATLTLSLSGWTDSGWAGLSAIDGMTEPSADDLLARRVLGQLGEGPATLATLAAQTGAAVPELHAVLRREMLRGGVLHVLPAHEGAGLYHARPLLASPPALEALQFRDAKERDAHRLLELDGAVNLVKVHHLGEGGVRIEGEVKDAKAHRTYLTSFTIDREGRTVDATCTSPQFRRSGLREGPTVPMIALRLAYSRQQADLERARGTSEGRRLIVAETRVLTRRERQGVTTIRVSLDHRKVIVRSGRPQETMRSQQLLFSTAQQAKDAYFERLERLGQRGFVDATAADMV